MGGAVPGSGRKHYSRECAENIPGTAGKNSRKRAEKLFPGAAGNIIHGNGRKRLSRLYRYARSGGPDTGLKVMREKK
jgi:hypothetical protein